MRMTRRGIALVELLAALVITSILGAAVFRLLDRSQRFASGIALQVDQRAQLAVAMFAIDGSLRGIASADGDVLAVSDSSIAYHGNVGSAVACAVSPSTVDAAATTLASGATLTWWNTTPQAGDSLLVLDEGPSLGAADDGWFRASLTAIASRTNACLHTPYLDSIADAGRVGWRLTSSRPLPATIVPGAVVRLSRPERFALYRSGSEWMLGWTEWNPAASAWHVIQPVAGPLLPYAPTGVTSGFLLRWRDSTGAPIGTGSSVAPSSADLVLGALTRQAVRMDGVASGVRRDSVSLRLPLRNAR